MTTAVDDGSIDYPQKYESLAEQYDAMRAKLRNHLHVLMTNALSAATNTHTSMCLFAIEHTAQVNLSDAMHSNLIAAEQCRQALNDLNAAR